jgi:hypothetical protein
VGDCACSGARTIPTSPRRWTWSWSAGQNGIVLEEQRAAYALRGRVIRPGRVKVGKYVTPAKA